MDNIFKSQDGSVTGVNLEGVAIGNGLFSTIKSLNTDISLTYMRGMHSKKLVVDSSLIINFQSSIMFVSL